MTEIWLDIRNSAMLWIRKCRRRHPSPVFVSLYIRGVPQFIDRLCEHQNR